MHVPFSYEGHSYPLDQEVQASLHQAWAPLDYLDPYSYLEVHMESAAAFLVAYLDSQAFAVQNLDPCCLEGPLDNLGHFQVAYC